MAVVSFCIKIVQFAGFYSINKIQGGASGQIVQRAQKRFVDLAKQDPGRARQKS